MFHLEGETDMRLPTRWTNDYWRPFNGLSELQSEMDRFFSSHTERGDNELSAPCDIEENESHFILSFDLPGVSKDQINIELNKNQLTVTGERKNEIEDKTRHRTERSYGKFVRSFTLPSSIDSERIEADFKDGVLTIAVAKLAAAKPRKIEIGSTPKKSDKFVNVNQTQKSA